MTINIINTIRAIFARLVFASDVFFEESILYLTTIPIASCSLVLILSISPYNNAFALALFPESINLI